MITRLGDIETERGMRLNITENWFFLMKDRGSLFYIGACQWHPSIVERKQNKNQQVIGSKRVIHAQDPGKWWKYSYQLSARKLFP
jgi:hypothetical protein